MSLLTSSSVEVQRWVQRMAALKRIGSRSAAKLISRHLQRSFGVYIGIDATIPASVRFPHPVGIVIGNGVVLGERVTVYQNVTLGGRQLGDGTLGLYPSVGADTVIYSGAVIAGAISVGCDCRVGANSVVLQDVPDGSTAVGVPARILRSAQP